MSIKKSTVIRPLVGWRMIDFSELAHYKDLFYFLSTRGIRTKYAQSILGVAWAVVQPLSQAVIFTLVFGKVAKLSSVGLPYAVFSYLALWPYSYFNGMITDSSNSLISNAKLINKVYFPRVILPLVSIASKFIDFILSSIVVIALLFLYRIVPGWQVVILPLLLVQLILSSVGIGMIIAAIGVKYRDVRHASSFIIQMVMYGSPVIYSTSSISPQWQWAYSLNPLVGVIEGFRSAFTNQPIMWNWIWPGTITAILIFIFALFYFRKMEAQFADIV